jgi:hypothetical protein
MSDFLIFRFLFNFRGMTKKGGKRPNAGRPKGAISEKSRTLLEVKDRIAKNADFILNAQLAEAKGTHLVYRLNPIAKKYVLVTDADEITECLNNYEGLTDGSLYIVTASKPDVKAGQYLLDRAFGKPNESLDVTSGGDKLQTVLIIPKVNDNNGDS